MTEVSFVKLPSNECYAPYLQVNIGSGNGLVLSGNKSKPEPMLTQSCVAYHGNSSPQWVKQSGAEICHGWWFLKLIQHNQEPIRDVMGSWHNSLILGLQLSRKMPL